MDDQQILRCSSAPVDREDHRSRLRAIVVSGEFGWGPLRHGWELRSAGQDPDQAQARPEGLVEAPQQ